MSRSRTILTLVCVQLIFVFIRSYSEGAETEETDVVETTTAGSETVEETTDEEEDAKEEIEIESHMYREPGCPLILERHGFDLKSVTGEWKIPFASMNWLADLATSLYKRRPRVREIRDLCLAVDVQSPHVNKKGNATMELDWECMKNKIQMAASCWPQRAKGTKSKFECYFPMGDFHAYVMVAAADVTSWMLLIRCRVGEGMSWAILSRTEKIGPEIAQVIFGLLEGYGFDLDLFKFEYTYDHCAYQ